MKYLNFKFIFLTLLSITLFTACDDDDTPQATVIDFGTAPASTLITTGTVTVITKNTVRYHTMDFAAGPYTVTVVETENDLVIVDLGPAPAFAAELETYVDALNKPASVIITHNHGDHYGGAVNFTDLTFYAESTVAQQLNSTAGFTDLYPNTVIGVITEQVLGGLTYSFGKVSNAETGENGYIYNEANKVLFSGDLVYNRAHQYLREYTPKEGDNEIDNWVNGLNVLNADFAGYNHVFVGHNGSRTDVGTVIAENIAYLEKAKGLIAGTATLTAGGTATSNQQVIDELLLLYPDYKDGGLYLSLPEAFFPGDPGADWF